MGVEHQRRERGDPRQRKEPLIEAIKASKLKVNWVPCDADTRHLALSATGGRDYVSGAYGMQRRDFA